MAGQRPPALGLLLHLAVCLCSLGAQWCAAEDRRIAYAPDVVAVDRMFLVALNVPKDAPEVRVQAPKSVELLDQTKLPVRSEVRKFYFRAVAPAKRAEVRFLTAGGDVVAPVEIWSFDDLRTFRKLKGVQLPRRWPLGETLPELKQRQTYPTGAEGKKPEKAPQGDWLDYSDDGLWAMQPDSAVPRWHHVNLKHGCPVHGKTIYRVRPYYPWIIDRKQPWSWKIKCPIGGEQYPSNDFARGDMTGGAFADDGIGGGCRHDGNAYAFVAELCNFYCDRMMQVAPECAHRYVSSGDPRYAHKALVAMCRLAVEYAYLATMTHHRHRNSVQQAERLGQGRFDEGPCLVRSAFTTYAVNQPSQLADHALAYDRIFPHIDRDEEIIPFLQKKGFKVKTHEDVRRFVEENLFAVWVQGIMDEACTTNEPGEQQAMAQTAAVLNYARGSEFVDWLYDGAGKMRVFVTNSFFRDGAPYEATGVYNQLHVSGLFPIVESMRKLRELRPQTYPEAKYPPLDQTRRYRNIFDFCMDTVTIGCSYPHVGDDGAWPDFGWRQYKKLDPITWHSADAPAFEHAWRLFRDPKFAWALARSPQWKPSAEMAALATEIERQAREWPDSWNDRSSLHDGYGLTILRGGQGDKRRAMWMRYGRARGHEQDDLMDIGLQGHQGAFLGHLGYPQNGGCWESVWSAHNVARQFPCREMTGQIELFADAPPVQLAEVRAQAFVDRVLEGHGYDLPAHDWQRRWLALVDLSADRFYALDFYRVSGGQEHWRALHCQEGEFSTGGIELSPPAPGTLAGPNVPYADPKWVEEHCPASQYRTPPMFPFAHLYNVQRGRAEGAWWADWRLKTGEGLHLRLNVLAGRDTEVNICDGRSPAGGIPHEMKWVMLRSQGEVPVRSQVLSVIEPYRDGPAVLGLRALAVEGADGPGFVSLACEVQLTGATDFVLAAANPSTTHVAGPISFAGRFGLYREREGVPLAVVLVGGKRLTKRQFGIRLESPEYRGRIVKINRQTETITIAPAPPRPGAMVGAQVFLANSSRRISYRVLEAKPASGGAELRLAGDSRVGMGRVTGAGKGQVLTDTPFVLDRYRYYDGARLVNASGTAEYRIVDARDRKAVYTDNAVHPFLLAETLSAEFPRDSWFSIYDYGVGDTVIWPYTVSLARVAPGRYRLSSPVPADVVLPEGNRVIEASKP
jgi:hypothetical protein